MSRLSALLPVAQGIAAHTALAKAADALIGIGDSRSRGQVMAGLLVQRLTGQARLDPARANWSSSTLGEAVVHRGSAAVHDRPRTSPAGCAFTGGGTPTVSHPVV